MNDIIKVSNLQKKFKQTIALRDVSFEVKEGEIFGLLGPSGSGKTTTINILTGQMESTSGSIEVLKRKEKELTSSQFRSEIGVLSDNSTLYERLTVYDNLKLFAKLYNASLEAIDEMLELVNMTEERQTVVSKLSKGMKQRILLCKAIMHQPKLAFLDEPTSALDPANIVHIHHGLKKLNELGTTIFLTTHDMEEATKLCDRVAFLHKGEIKEIGNPIDLRYKYASEEFHIETASGENLTLPNAPSSAEQIHSLISNEQLKQIHTDFPTLGEVFLQITGEELEK
ncbi:MAG TPA: ABC transporter ATP-binding protein [Bacillota bacterium]|nr:ABC transporter ATP-binding protein [Bacillota bacterium]